MRELRAMDKFRGTVITAGGKALIDSCQTINEEDGEGGTTRN